MSTLNDTIVKNNVQYWLWEADNLEGSDTNNENIDSRCWLVFDY